MLASTEELAVSEIFRACIGAYSHRTIRGYSSDLRTFVRWCGSRGHPWFPTAPAVLAEFVDDQVLKHSLSTIKRRLCAIAFAHRIRDLPAPTASNVVRLAVRRAARKRARRPKQVRGLTNAIREQIIAACPSTLAGFRDAALISVGYDSLCRSSELAVMQVEHVMLDNDETAMVIIPRSKSDVAGDGRVAYLSPQTTSLLTHWLEEAGLEAGPLFRGLHLNRPSDGPLATSSIRRLIKRATMRAGLDPSIAKELSGHSMRIGAAQDMMNAGFDALAIMQAGGWKSANVVLRYVEKASARDLHTRRWQSLIERSQ